MTSGQRKQNTLKYLSVCSGIEAATVAWESLGAHPIAFSEIEPFPCAVLAEHYPDVPNLGDMTQYKEWDIEQPDILVGGTPCQSFSVAGLRGGLADPRGNLMLTFGAIARAVRPTWIVWENVPGVLSSNGGRDFGTFLGMLAELGYGFAYRVLDAQYVRVESHARAVPQRRRRVFVVGHLGDWRRAAAVLFESESLQGYPPPSRETGARVADPITESFAKHGGASAGKDSFPRNVIQVAATLNAGGNTGGFRTEPGEHLVVHPLFGKTNSSHDESIEIYILDIVHQAMSSKWSKGTAGPAGDEHHNLVSHALRTEGFDASEDGTGRGAPIVAFQEAQIGCREYDTAGTLRANGPRHDPVGTRLRIGSAVRKLTPRECERLMGFPDDYTLITYRGKPAADSPRYRALGNSMAVNIMRWIGERIKGRSPF